MKKIIWAVIVILVLVVGGVAIYKNQNEKIMKVEPLKIAYLKEMGFAPVFVAQEKGFFKDAGLDVELVEVDSKQLLDVLITNKVDASAAGLASIAGMEIEKSGLIKMFGVGGESTNGETVSALLVRKDSPIQKIDDLKGKTVATDAAKNIAGIKLIFSKIGIDPDKDIKIMEVGKEVIAQALINKQIDAIYAHQPTPAILAGKFDVRIIETNLRAKYIVDPYWNAALVVVTSEFAKNNPQTIKKLFDAYDNAIKFIRNNPDETKQISIKYTPLTEDVIKNVGLISMLSPKENVDFENMDKIIDSLVQTGILKQKVDIKNMFILP